MFFTILIYGILTIGSTTVDSEHTSKIAKRDYEVSHSIPPQVLLKNNGKRIGVGILINDLFMLTTWTLLKPYQNYDHIEVIDEEGSPITRKIQSVKYYYDYYEVRPISTNEIRPIHNIALVLLNYVHDPRLEKISRYLPIANHSYETSTKAMLHGFNDLGKPVRGVMETVNSEECALAYEKYNYTYSGEMCAQGIEPYKTKPCKGDEGTPLIIDDKLVGIFSWLDHCSESESEANSPSVFTNVSFHSDFINEGMRIMLGGKPQAFDIGIEEGAITKFSTWLFGSAEECKIGPEERTIPYSMCVEACKNKGSVRGGCEKYHREQCICLSVNGDIPLYNKLYPELRSKKDDADATCLATPCPRDYKHREKWWEKE
ncbi:hypothetical protein QAD02_001234 [Eretmocerus hayati]|uniref:Uncharacterized protein n=1 Tax=Eretmocerus hayati TaxID=131215 RepID=A0ACC2NK88_9HYME|nr:hypothetical protein QAD02_001234 [Eretmocerus hayati]